MNEKLIIKFLKTIMHNNDLIDKEVPVESNANADLEQQTMDIRDCIDDIKHHDPKQLKRWFKVNKIIHSYKGVAKTMNTNKTSKDNK